MSKPVCYPSGVTNRKIPDPLAMYPFVDPTTYITYFNDFHTYASGDWTITTTELGGGDATEALADASGGVLLITNDAADNDADFFQKVGEGFLLSAGKKAFFKCRFKVSDATQSDVVIGLQVTDTTPLDATDGIYFQKDDGDANIDFYVRKNATTGSNSKAAAGTLVDDTYIVLAWYYDGISTVQAFVDGTPVASLSATSAYLPDTELTVSFGLQNGEAVAKTMSVDYVFAALER